VKARLCRWLCLIALLVPLTGLCAGESGVLVLGRISDDPKAHYEQLRPLLEYVVPRMRDVGIREGRILMARDPQQMASYLRRGRVDWVTETAATAVLLRNRADARPLLLTERDGTRQYHTVFFARRDSRLRRVEDLRGRTVAFQRPSSTSAYFAPASHLLGRGFALEILPSPAERVDSNAVGYVFARSELNISTWVHKRIVDAGVMSHLDWDNPQRMPMAFKRDFVMIGRTDDYPRAVELVRGTLDAKVAERLRAVLLGAASDSKAGPALRQFFGTTRFLALDAPSQGALDRLASGVARVRTDVE
jgi:phosphonate transport system substrate-binding protein